MRFGITSLALILAGGLVQAASAAVNHPSQAGNASIINVHGGGGHGGGGFHGGGSFHGGGGFHGGTGFHGGRFGGPRFGFRGPFVGFGYPYPYAYPYPYYGYPYYGYPYRPY